MTREEIMALDMEGIEERRAQIREEIKAAGDDAALDAIEAEKAIIEERIAALKVEQRKADMAAVLAGKGKTKENMEEKRMDFKEFRNSKEYIDAYAEYIKKGNDREIRLLISQNAGEGVEGNRIPVPTYLEERIATAWENDPILSRVRRTNYRGNLEIPFEVSATDAVVHAEGAEPPQEEELVIGTVVIVPEFIKKWIQLTDTVIRLKGRKFLDYIYDEITYKITLEAARQGVLDILNAPATTSTSGIGVPVVSGAPSVTVIPEAAAYLSSEAGTPVVLMNRLTEIEFLNAQVAGSFSVDPFAGLTKLYTSALPAYSAAASGAPYVIVGNLYGLQFNFPDGDDVEIIYDPYTKAEENLVKVVGRYFASHGVTSLGHFVKVAKP